MTAVIDNAVFLGKPPSFTQQAFIDACEKEEVFGGSKRGGKTVAGSIKAVMMSVLFPGNKGYILRQDLTDLKESTLETFLRICPPELILDHNHTERRIMLRTSGVPSKIIYSGLSDQSEEESSKGKEAGWVWIDEPSEIKQGTYLMYLSQLCWELPPCGCPAMDRRSKRCGQHPMNPGFPPFQAWLTTNPEAGWVEDRFRALIELASEQRKVVSNGKQVFIRSLPRDNPYLPPGWEAELRQGNTPDIWVKKYLDGVWGSVEGQVYKSYDERYHCLNLADIPPAYLHSLSLIGCLDHATTGITNFSVNGVDPDGNIVALESYYQANRRVSEHAADIKHLTTKWAILCGKCDERYPGKNFGQHPALDFFDYVLIDPSTQAKTQTTANELTSIQDLYYREGIPTLAAHNTLEAGIDLMQEYLHVKPTHIHPFHNSRPSPSFFIIRDGNRDGIKELVGWKCVIGEKGVKKYVGPDHWLDCQRYIMMSRPEPPRFTKKDILCMDTHAQKATKAMAQFDNKFAAPAGAGQWFSGGSGNVNHWFPERLQ
jgi:Terminase large subunit, T4likevirus-type, N-terminal